MGQSVRVSKVYFGTGNSNTLEIQWIQKKNVKPIWKGPNQWANSWSDPQASLPSSLSSPVYSPATAT
jgi:hypothetical protein